MYMSSINFFTAGWLVLCIWLNVPFCSKAEKSNWIPYGTNNLLHYQRRSTQPDLEEQFRSNVQKPAQYTRDSYYSKYNLMQPGTFSKGRHYENNEKPNMARSVSEHQLRKVYNPYHSQFVGNQENSKKRSEREENREIDEEILKKLNMLDKVLSEDVNENDIEKNTLEDAIIAEMKMSEETKRVVRQVRKRRPGFFWTLAKLAFETYNDTRSAIQQISNFINETIEPDITTQRSVSSHPLIVDTTTIASSTDQNTTSTDMSNVNTTTTSTTQAPFRLTPTNLQNLIRRNLRGLVRLFNIEWQDALNQSEISVREFQKNLGNQVNSFLQDNPDAF